MKPHSIDLTHTQSSIPEEPEPTPEMPDEHIPGEDPLPGISEPIPGSENVPERPEPVIHINSGTILK